MPSSRAGTYPELNSRAVKLDLAGVVNVKCCG